MLTAAMVRDAWLRAEVLCECQRAAHGHPGWCNQFLIWAERGETGRCQTASTDSAGTRTTTETRRGRLGRPVRVLAPSSPRGRAPRT